MRLLSLRKRYYSISFDLVQRIVCNSEGHSHKNSFDHIPFCINMYINCLRCHDAYMHKCAQYSLRQTNSMANAIRRAGGGPISLRLTYGTWKIWISKYTYTYIFLLCVCLFVCLSGAKIHYFIISRILHVYGLSHSRAPNASEFGLFSFIWKLVK